jgi:3-dehydroquinate synthase
MAELIKTAILDGSGGFLDAVSSLRKEFSAPDFRDALVENQAFLGCVGRSVAIKGRIVEADPRETGTQRVLLNLGHTFGHALEAAAGLGSISHGEAVAWGISRACELGHALGITGTERLGRIVGMLRSFGYETGDHHPLMKNKAVFMDALLNDKKKKAGKLTFIVPNQTGAQLVSSDAIETGLLERICGV